MDTFSDNAAGDLPVTAGRRDSFDIIVLVQPEMEHVLRFGLGFNRVERHGYVMKSQVTAVPQTPLQIT